jgi:hypothetical protein
MTDLIAHIREVIDEHVKRECRDDGGLHCRCGAKELTDHSAHVAQAIADRLQLGREAVGDKVRNASALFDEELTILEGAE